MLFLKKTLKEYANFSKIFKTAVQSITKLKPFSAGFPSRMMQTVEFAAGRRASSTAVFELLLPTKIALQSLSGFVHL